jgi:hypothetical protein
LFAGNLAAVMEILERTFAGPSALNITCSHKYLIPVNLPARQADNSF